MFLPRQILKKNIQCSKSKCTVLYITQRRRFGNAAFPDKAIPWFYATDLPLKVKPEERTKLVAYGSYNQGPTKFMVLSPQDSKRVEMKYLESIKEQKSAKITPKVHDKSSDGDADSHPDPDPFGLSKHELLVREDGLFTADVTKFTLFPTYWSGPKYELRRGVWFSDEMRPCGFEIANALESLRQMAKMTNSLSVKNSQGLTKSIPHPHHSNMLIELTLFPGDPDNAKMVLKPSSDEDSLLNVWSKLSLAKSLTRITSIDEKKLTKLIASNSKTEASDKSSDKSENSTKASDTTATNASSDGGSGSVTNLLSSIFNLKDKKSKLENQMEHDYPENFVSSSSGDDGKNYNRPVDHLVLCVHGIGQKLSQRLESMSFVHDVNLLRTHLKTLYKGPDNNNGIQVLPVLWRHDVDFAMTRDQLNLKDKNTLPVSLRDITVSGISSVRNIIGDVVLDVLLYNEPKIKQEILSSITLQVNTLLRRFMTLNNMKRPPTVSVIGHSLGSVISYDLLSSRSQKGFVLSNKIQPSKSQLEFPVENLICLGSPLGLYQLIQGKYIVNDQLKNNVKSLYNIFHPTDPISYRMEPLIVKEAADIDPEPVPFVQGSFLSQVQQFTEIGQKFSNNATNLLANLAKIGFQDSKQDQELLEGQKDSDDPELDESKNKSESEKDAKKPTLTKAQIDAIKDKLREINPSRSRVDFEIQTGMLDFSLFTAVASHMSYFDDQDLADFIQRILKPDSKSHTESTKKPNGTTR